MGSGGRAGSGAGVRGGCEVEVSWEELSELSRYCNSNQYAPHLRQSAVRVLGLLRGTRVLSELSAGRTPLLRPVRR